MWSAIKASANSLRLYLFERGIGTPSTFPSGEVFFLGKVGPGGHPNSSTCGHPKLLHLNGV